MIPDWNSQGVLPPVRPGAGGTAADRSPYRVSLHQLVTTFAFLRSGQLSCGDSSTTVPLCTPPASSSVSSGLTAALLRTLRRWKGESPTIWMWLRFVVRQRRGYDHLFASAAMKEAFHIDAYLYRIDPPLTSDRVRWIAYWYSLLAHRRNGLWKGFVAVDLSPVEDPDARETH